MLYEKYRPVALKGAERYLAARHRSQAEDVVEVTFCSIHDALRRGHGPKGPFRSYLLLSIRREAARQQRRRDRETVMESDLLDSVDRFSGIAPPVAVTGEMADHRPAAASQDAIDPELLLGDVYRGLNARFRHALWLSEVEGRTPEELAPLLGITPNAAAALCYRARRALRAGYFGAYAATLASPTCKPLISDLASFVEAGQPASGYDTIRSHLDGCAACRDVARGSARSGTVLAGLGPFGLLSTGAWLDPAREPITQPPARGREHAAAAAAVLLLLVALVAIAAWPSSSRQEQEGAHAAPAPSSAQVTTTIEADGGATEPAPAPADRPRSDGSPAPATTAPAPRAEPEDSAPESDPPETGPDGSAPSDPPPTTGSIRGLVTADHDGTGPAVPVASQGTPIRVLDAGGREVHRAITDGSGAFTTVPLPPGTYRIMATEPVGMVVDGAGAGSAHGSQRREVEVATAAVWAGGQSVFETAFVPWRQLSVGGGNASATAARAGGAVSWTFDLASSRSTTPGAIAEVVFAHPAGTVLGFDWAPPEHDRHHGSDRPSGIPGASACKVAPGRTATVVRCDVGTLGPTASPFSIQVRLESVPSSGWIVPQLSLTTQRAAVERGERAGQRVRVDR